MALFGGPHVGCHLISHFVTSSYGLEAPPLFYTLYASVWFSLFLSAFQTNKHQINTNPLLLFRNDLCDLFFKYRKTVFDRIPYALKYYPLVVMYYMMS